MDVPALKKSHIIEVKKVIAEETTLAEQNSSYTDNAIQKMLQFEKITRHDNDLDSSKLLTDAMLGLLSKQKRWEKFCELVPLLCRRHAQLKQIVIKVVRLAMNALPLTSSDNTKLRLLRALRDVSRGKMHVEYEYAQMTRKFAQMKETEGEIQIASDVLQEINVEALSSMKYDEKFDYLLEQFRLTLKVNDFERAELASKKFDLQWLDRKCSEPNGLKKRYFRLICEYHLREGRLKEVSKSELDLARLEEIGGNLNGEAAVVLCRAALYSCLAKGDQIVLIIRKEILKIINEAPWASNLTIFADLLTALTEQKFIDRKSSDETAIKCYQNCNLPLPSKTSTKSLIRNDIQIFMTAIKQSVVYHNVKVAAKHYQRITIERLSELCDLTAEKSEQIVCEMVQSHELNALIDRPARIITFKDSQNDNFPLDKWGDTITSCVMKVERACHLIEKEKVLFG